VLYENTTSENHIMRILQISSHFRLVRRVTAKPTARQPLHRNCNGIMKVPCEAHVVFGGWHTHSAVMLRCVGVQPLNRRQYLSGIENILRIERGLDRAHGVDGLTTKFGLEVFLLALPDAVLAGAGAAHRLRAFDQPVHEVLAARHLFVILDIAQ
jgi:hypothetical protein